MPCHKRWGRRRNSAVNFIDALFHKTVAAYSTCLLLGARKQSFTDR